MDIGMILLGAIAVVVFLVCGGASSSSKNDPSNDPEYMEIRTNSDGLAYIYNYKTEEIVKTFTARSDAEAFLADLKEQV